MTLWRVFHHRDLPELPQEPPDESDPDAEETDYWERADAEYERKRDMDMED